MDRVWCRAPQVSDYGCYLKMDAGEDVLGAQALLLKVFMLIGGRQCNEYINALTASIMLWGHYEAVNHPCWQLFKQNASAFNEEAGEIALSVFAGHCARRRARRPEEGQSNFQPSQGQVRACARVRHRHLRATISGRATVHVMSLTIRLVSKPRRLFSRLSFDRSRRRRIDIMTRPVVCWARAPPLHV